MCPNETVKFQNGSLRWKCSSLRKDNAVVEHSSTWSSYDQIQLLLNIWNAKQCSKVMYKKQKCAKHNVPWEAIQDHLAKVKVEVIYKCLTHRTDIPNLKSVPCIHQKLWARSRFMERQDRWTDLKNIPLTMWHAETGLNTFVTVCPCSHASNYCT